MGKRKSTSWDVTFAVLGLVTVAILLGLRMARLCQFIAIDEDEEIGI